MICYDNGGISVFNVLFYHFLRLCVRTFACGAGMRMQFCLVQINHLGMNYTPLKN